MEYVIPVLPTPSLAVEGVRGRFPVHRIYCVGRNYAEHAREMGHDPDREPPFFFMKPADSIITDGGDFAYPSHSQDVHHEAGAGRRPGLRRLRRAGLAGSRSRTPTGTRSGST